MPKTIIVAETEDCDIFITEYNPAQFTFRAAALAMEEEHSMTFCAFVAVIIHDDGSCVQIDFLIGTASNTRQVR